MPMLSNTVPKGYIQIPQHEYDMLIFKSECYDNIDTSLNEGLEYTHRLAIANVMTDFHDGMESAYINTFKELRKDELRKRTGGGKLFPVQTGDSDLSW